MLLRIQKTVRRSVLCPLLAAVCWALAGCDHDHGHDHGDDHVHAGEEGPEPIAITRWTEGHELFVELDPPEPGQPVGYHAHVTILDGFQPAKEGSLSVRYLQGERVAAEARIDGVARPGIFTPEAPAPSGGRYQLTMTYEHGATRVVFDCGAITVGAAAEDEAAEDGAALSFLKEQQWKVSFATAWAETRPMAREIELPAVVEAPGADQLTIAAPTGGRFFHRDEVALAEGIMLKKGTVIGHVAPTVAGDDFSRLQLAVDEARLAKEQAERELARIAPLVAEGILPAKRRIELESEIEATSARLVNARRRVGQVVSQRGEGGIPLEATRSGRVAQVLAGNGAPVAPGEPLVRLVGDGPLWAKARFVQRPGPALAGARPVALRIAGRRIDLGPGAELLSSQPIVDQDTQLASWTAKLGALDDGALQPGVAGVLLVRVGEPVERVAVPEDAVVEINTQSYVFVQTGGESFHKRGVSLGVRDGGFIEVLAGVSAGERIVTRGGFDIHLAAVMGTVESHRH